MTETIYNSIDLNKIHNTVTPSTPPQGIKREREIEKGRKMCEKEKLLLKKMPVNKHRMNEGIRKSPLWTPRFLRFVLHPLPACLSDTTLEKVLPPQSPALGVGLSLLAVRKSFDSSDEVSFQSTLHVSFPIVTALVNT